MICSKCHKELPAKLTKANTERVPKGWKRRGHEVFCASCWGRLYKLRAITIPVHSVEGITWQEFLKRCNESWREAARALNFCIQELRRHDSIPRAGEKLAKCPTVNLYAALRAFSPALSSDAVNGLTQIAIWKYSKLRLKSLKEFSARLPEFSFPQPFPFRASGITLSWNEQGKPTASILFPERITLILKNHPRDFGRQLGAIRKLINGHGALGECQIISRAKHILFKIVAWLPREAIEVSEAVMVVSTDKDSFLIATCGNNEIWRLNADHVRRWNAEHYRRLHRLSDDLKFELRSGGSDDLAVRRETICNKYHDRLDTFCHQISRQIANRAARFKCKEVLYSDQERGYLPDIFPWYKLKQRLQEKLDAYGIHFRELKLEGATEGADQSDSPDDLTPPESCGESIATGCNGEIQPLHESDAIFT